MKKFIFNKKLKVYFEKDALKGALIESNKNVFEFGAITIYGSDASNDSEKEKITDWLKKLGIFE